MRALVLSGGGAKGSYQAGAIKHLLGDKAIHYDVICGTSVGALNGAFLAMFPQGSEADAAAALQDLWFSIDDSKVWRRWYGGALGRLPVLLPRWLGGKPSVYSTKPLQRLVARRLRPDAIATSGKKLRVGATSLETGARETWTELDPDVIVDGVLASSSFPFFFEPIRVDGEAFTDDGVREITPIENAIEAGADEIHVIGASPPEDFDRFARRPSGLDVLERSLEAMGAEIDKWDFKAVDLYNALHDAGAAPDKKKIALRVQRPVSPLRLDSSLDFNPERIRKNFERGYADAVAFGW